MEEVRIRYGIELVKRLCALCKRSYFWVSRKSAQKYCCLDCAEAAGEKINPAVLFRITGGRGL